MYLLAMPFMLHFYSGAPVPPGEHLLNGAAPSYNVYQTKDGGWISLGSLEPHFYANLCRAMGREDFIPHQYDGAKREEIFAYFREQFRTRTRDEWFDYLKQSDICVAPVYSLEEAAADPHNQARQMVVEVEHPHVGPVRQVGIGPKFSETPGRVRSTAPHAGQHTDEVLASLGYAREQIEGLRASGAVG
jgi:crotonobetainyl-CoA:carnitine CoA-transferase CaiB-like acyl-CoA transferase